MQKIMKLINHDEKGRKRRNIEEKNKKAETLNKEKQLRPDRTGEILAPEKKKIFVLPITPGQAGPVTIAPGWKGACRWRR